MELHLWQAVSHHVPLPLQAWWRKESSRCAVRCCFRFVSLIRRTLPAFHTSATVSLCDPQVTEDISDLSCADVFSEVGKKVSEMDLCIPVTAPASMS